VRTQEIIFFPGALKLYQSAGLYKIYYSHFNFEVMTFLLEKIFGPFDNYNFTSSWAFANHTAPSDLQLPLRKWGTGNVYLLVLSQAKN
jgi:hypothetical protein